ncbi:hypothetical protein [Sandaracinus amylolyticus]|uniref:Uncharacterized protein n=1 Tax=Sandaracinus amylolyticus TaxID=927083 RepID=A0A0F6YKQ3_9BACT|nr:hypothetical protein [Sandaracinus amylolyticus]AKF08638.1 hypothetical protein DB32_005787 [Sandaracinus amylolyticus]
MTREEETRATLARAVELLSETHALVEASPEIREQLAPLFDSALLAIGDARRAAASSTDSERVLRQAREAEHIVQALARFVRRSAT